MQAQETGQTKRDTPNSSDVPLLSSSDECIIHHITHGSNKPSNQYNSHIHATCSRLQLGNITIVDEAGTVATTTGTEPTTTGTVATTTGAEGTTTGTAATTTGTEGTTTGTAGSTTTGGDATPAETTKVIDTINSGTVNENTINQDISTKAPSGINGFIVVVTVITQAASDSNGNAHFQTFVDVTGSTVPTETDKTAICNAIGDSLATHLGVTRDQVSCDLTAKSRRRADYQFVANLLVAPTDSLQQASVAIAIVGSTFLAAVVYAFALLL